MGEERPYSRRKAPSKIFSSLVARLRSTPRKALETGLQAPGDGLKQVVATEDQIQHGYDVLSHIQPVSRPQTTLGDSDLRATPTQQSRHTVDRRPPSLASQKSVRPQDTTHAIIPASDTLNKEPSARHQLLPETIRCNLFVSYNGKELDVLKNIQVKWNFPSSFGDLESRAQELLSSQGKGTTKLYLKLGRCSLIIDRTGKRYSSGTLEAERQWLETVAHMVTSFWSQYPDRDFHLQVHLEYSGHKIQREYNETYADTIRHILHTKMPKNWEGKGYISNRDLNYIMSDATVAELIREDESLRAYEPGGREYNPSYDRLEFIEHVQLHGCKLLALFVCVKLPLSCLWKIMSEGKEESDLPFTDENPPNPRRVSEWDHLLNIQGGFLAHVFKDDEGVPKHQELDRHTVVPIRHHKVIGEGSFGEVSEVSIDPAHHAFSNDKTQRFALKKFFDQGSRTQGDFQNESRMLGLLAKIPHPHITRHLALWSQKEKFYMLFPLAEQNLRHYITHTNHPSLTKDSVEWLLNQFKGLADGVRQIHNLTGLGPGILDRRLSVNHKRERTGFHHDLKPENILVFLDNHRDSDDQVTGRTWKIADFGSARIGLILSGSAPGVQEQSYFTSNLSHGDTAYGAPDYELEKKTSRPYDMWSLGCIFLECLLWVFGKPDSSPADFAAQRMIIPNTLANQDSAFWYVGNDGNIRLKPAVVQRLKELKIECAERGVFKELVSIVAKLLTIPPAERLDAPKLCNDLDAIILQAKVDLHGNEGFYTQKHNSQKRDIVAAPPTTAGDHDRLSIDERQIAPQPQHRIASSPTLPSSNRRSMSNRRGKQVEDLEPFQSFGSGSDGRIQSLSNGGIPFDEKRLSPLKTQDLHPASPRPRTPSISLSFHEGNVTPRTADSALQNGVHDPSPAVGWQPPYFRPDDHPWLRRSNSRESRRSGRSFTWPQTPPREERTADQSEV
jgi:serine/threonine protein kinase